MTELEKMQRAKMYIDKMANGINPIDDKPVAESDMINNVRLSRCLFYVSDILRQVIENNGAVSKKRVTKKAFFLSADRIHNFSVSRVPIPISEITKRLNDLANLEECCKLKTTTITNWLISIGVLEIIEIEGKNTKRPTERGRALGIFEETRRGTSGEYVVVVYNKDAQQFILSNIETIVSNDNKKDTKKAEKSEKDWSPAHEECLTDLFSKKVPISEIAVTLMRTNSEITEKLKKMGLTENI